MIIVIGFSEKPSVLRQLEPKARPQKNHFLRFNSRQTSICEVFEVSQVQSIASEIILPRDRATHGNRFIQ